MVMCWGHIENLWALFVDPLPLEGLILSFKECFSLAGPYVHLGGNLDGLTYTLGEGV